MDRMMTNAAVVTLALGSFALGAAVVTLVAVAQAKPPARECLEVCKAADAASRAFYAHDGACLCLPACPACAVCTPTPAVEETP